MILKRTLKKLKNKWRKKSLNKKKLQKGCISIERHSLEGLILLIYQCEKLFKGSKAQHLPKLTSIKALFFKKFWPGQIFKVIIQLKNYLESFNTVLSLSLWEKTLRALSNGKSLFIFYAIVILHWETLSYPKICFIVSFLSFMSNWGNYPKTFSVMTWVKWASSMIYWIPFLSTH